MKSQSSARAASERHRPGTSTILIIATLESRFQQRVLNEINRLVNVLSAIDVTKERKRDTY